MSELTEVDHGMTLDWSPNIWGYCWEDWLRWHTTYCYWCYQWYNWMTAMGENYIMQWEHGCHTNHRVTQQNWLNSGKPYKPQLDEMSEPILNDYQRKTTLTRRLVSLLFTSDSCGLIEANPSKTYHRSNQCQTNLIHRLNSAFLLGHWLQRIR